MKGSILIVEDEALQAMTLEMKLKNEGFSSVSCAYNPSEALEIMGEKEQDIVLMDIALTDSMDGIELAEIIMEKYNSQVIFLTGNSDPLTRNRAEGLKPLGYLLKPVNMGTLMDIIRSLA